MAHPPMQSGWIDRPHQRLRLDDFELESGQSIKDFELSYVVHGPSGATSALNSGIGQAGQGRVVLALSAVASNHHRLDFLIGPGLALDPAEVTIIAVDAIGNGLTTSPSTSIRQPGQAFPQFSIRDMVRSQIALLDHLGIDQLDTVIGASMGGMQALQWAVSAPTRMRRVVAMTPMARTTPWAAAINETSRRALLTDPACLSGSLGAWSAWVPLMQLLSGRTPSQIDRQFGNAEAVIDWIGQRVDWWHEQHFAAVDWLYQSRAYDAHDVGKSPGFGGDTAAALASIQAAVLVLAPPLDLYNSAAAAREAADGIGGARFVQIESDWGHQAASAADATSAAFLNRTIGDFLRQP